MAKVVGRPLSVAVTLPTTATCHELVESGLDLFLNPQDVPVETFRAFLKINPPMNQVESEIDRSDDDTSSATSMRALKNGVRLNDQTPSVPRCEGYVIVTRRQSDLRLEIRRTARSMTRANSSARNALRSRARAFLASSGVNHCGWRCSSIG